MLIEQITYVLQPGRAPALMAAYEQQGLEAIQRNLGVLMAWGYADVGGMDEVTQLWCFKDAADRERRHAALAADAGWKAFAGEFGHLLVSRRNALWRTASFSPTFPGAPA